MFPYAHLIIFTCILRNINVNYYYYYISQFLFKLSKIRMVHGKCSRSPFTVTGQSIQRRCHLSSLKFETLLALQAIDVKGKK